jgi:hypothetical protein
VEGEGRTQEQGEGEIDEEEPLEAVLEEQVDTALEEDGLVGTWACFSATNSRTSFARRRVSSLPVRKMFRTIAGWPS